MDLPNYAGDDGAKAIFHPVLRECARKWLEYSGRPRPADDVLKLWDKFIDAWANDVNLPLLVRRRFSNISRGDAYYVRLGNTSDFRQVIRTDNSPAVWAYGTALLEICPHHDREEIQNLLEKIPMSISKDGTTYATTLSSKATFNVNSHGWQVCHIDSVSKGHRASLANEDGKFIVSGLNHDDLKNHFKRLMKPSNMFLVPKEYGFLGELDEIVDAFK